MIRLAVDTAFEQLSMALIEIIPLWLVTIQQTADAMPPFFFKNLMS